MTKHTCCELLIDWAGNEEPRFTEIYFSNPESAITTYMDLRAKAKGKPYFAEDERDERFEDEWGFCWSEDGSMFNCTCVNLYFNSVYYTADEPVSIDELIKE